MESNIVSELQKQMNRERANAQAYRYIAASFENLAYSGLASFFRKQAGDEEGHAGKFQDFLISKRIRPVFTPIPDVVIANTPQALAKFAVDVEIGTTEDLKTLYDLSEDDPQVCALLNWFLLEQIEEESWSQDLYDLISSSDCSSTILLLDKKYGEM